MKTDLRINQTPEERNKNYSTHLWAEGFGGKFGDRICVRCGAVINMFELRKILRDGTQIIPECKPTQKT